MIPSDIEWGLTELRDRRDLYDLLEAYYDGRHRMAFATDRFRDTFGNLFEAFALNLCPTVIDTLIDRIQVTGFTDTTDAGGVNQAAAAIWAESRMDVQAGEVHRDAAVKGDAYVIVWQDEAGFPLLFPNDARRVIVRYDPDRPGRVAFAVKCWPAVVAGGKPGWRVTVYYEDRVERYVVDGDQYPTGTGKLRELQDRDVPDGEDARPVVEHAWGVVPVFHFPANSRVGALGRSDLLDVVPLQDACNKSIADLLVASERESLPSRWATGIEVPTDENGRALPPPVRTGELLVSPTVESRFGQFPTVNLEAMRRVADGFATDIARVTGTPLHQILQSGDWPSGEALKTAEARLVKKARDRIATWGPVWADVMGLALRMGEQEDAGVRALFEDPDTRVSEKELAETALLKRSLGVPLEQVLRELGYSDEQAKEIALTAEDAERRSAEAAARAFNAGLGAA